MMKAFLAVLALSASVWAAPYTDPPRDCTSALGFWTNVSYLCGLDGTYAAVTASSTATVTTYGFVGDVPYQSKISGIEVLVTAYREPLCTGVHAIRVGISTDSGSTWSMLKSINANTTLETLTYGGSGDIWVHAFSVVPIRHPWQFNDGTTLRAQISVVWPRTIACPVGVYDKIFVDAVQARIYYKMPDGAAQFITLEGLVAP